MTDYREDVTNSDVGCDCGAIPSTCTGPGCYSSDAAEQWRDENGIPAGDGSW